MEERHTATPWCIGEVNFEENTDTHIGIRDEAGDWVVCEVQCDVAELPGRANAEFIARACNAHDDLVEALQESLKWIFGQADKDEDQEQWDIVKEIRAALTKAGVQS